MQILNNEEDPNDPALIFKECRFYQYRECNTYNLNFVFSRHLATLSERRTMGRRPVRPTRAEQSDAYIHAWKGFRHVPTTARRGSLETRRAQ